MAINNTTNTITWQEEIRILGRDFCIPRKVVERIIRSTETINKGDLYNIAWKQLFKLM